MNQVFHKVIKELKYLSIIIFFADLTSDGSTNYSLESYKTPKKLKYHQLESVKERMREAIGIR